MELSSNSGSPHTWEASSSLPLDPLSIHGLEFPGQTVQEIHFARLHGENKADADLFGEYESNDESQPEEPVFQVISKAACQSNPPLDGDEDLQNTLDICIPHAVNDYILNKLPGEILTDKEELFADHEDSPHQVFTDRIHIPDARIQNSADLIIHTLWSCRTFPLLNTGLQKFCSILQHEVSIIYSAIVSLKIQGTEQPYKITCTLDKRTFTDVDGQEIPISPDWTTLVCSLVQTLQRSAPQEKLFSNIVPFPKLSDGPWPILRNGNEESQVEEHEVEESPTPIKRGRKTSKPATANVKKARKPAKQTPGKLAGSLQSATARKQRASNKPNPFMKDVNAKKRKFEKLQAQADEAREEYREALRTAHSALDGSLPEAEA